MNQRAIDRHHVRALEGSMRTTIGRTEPADRLKVSMSRANFEASLMYTGSNIQRLRQLLKDSEWNIRVYRFCLMRWGRERFSIDTWIKAIRTRLPQVCRPINICPWF